MASVLIVEPDAECRNRYQNELEREGHRIRTALTGPEALAKIAEGVPDILVLEICLPGMDGLDLMLRIRDRHPRLPIILYSRSSRYFDHFQSWAADVYLVKSEDTAPLHGAIRALVPPAMRARANGRPARVSPAAHRHASVH